MGAGKRSVAIPHLLLFLIPNKIFFFYLCLDYFFIIIYIHNLFYFFLFYFFFYQNIISFFPFLSLNSTCNFFFMLKTILYLF